MSTITCSYDRIEFIGEHAWRWQGNLIFVIYCDEIEEQLVLKWIATHSIPDRIMLVLHIVSSSYRAKVFPINKLRNLGITNVRTTHYVVMDMDMWPVRTLFDEVQKAPLDVLKNPMSAIIIPLMFFNQDRILGFCSSFESCMRRYV